MTGLLDRLRSWVGAVFGRGTAETDDDDAPTVPESNAPDRRVVHRDDRPLETPSTMDRPTPPSASTPARVEVPDAEADVADRPAPADVSIPDAEAPTDPEAPDGPEPDAAVACSVCGTTVDDPSAPCPLCRSTDVVSVADAPDEVAGETPADGRRTAVSTTDDDAVERLRDVRGGE